MRFSKPLHRPWTRPRVSAGIPAGRRAPGLLLAAAWVAGTAGATLAPPGAAAQAGALAEPDTLHADSVALAAADLPSDPRQLGRALRAAQARFERIRLRESPRAFGGGWGSSCDEIVGRICLRYGEGGDWWPEPEAEAIVEARQALLAVLEAGSGALPDDDWVAGQRVRYLGEAGLWEAAAAVAGPGCRATPWWCRALEGYVHHGSLRTEEADAAFRDALAAMPPELRARWEEVDDLFDHRGRDLLDDVRNAARDAGGDPADLLEPLVERAWALADPLWLVPGNDRRAAHFARRVAVAMREDARTTWGMSWGDDLEELLVRYGPEAGWERVPPRTGSLELRPSAIGHHDPESRGYVPPGDVLERPSGAATARWIPGKGAERSGHAPAYAPVVIPIDGRVRALALGDSVALLARWALPRDTTYHRGHDHPPFEAAAPWRGRPVEAGLFFLPERGGPPYRIRATGRSAGTFLLVVPAEPGTAGLEAWDPAAGLAGRLRTGVPWNVVAPDVPVASDLLLLSAAPPDSFPDLASLAERLRPDSLYAPGDTLVVAWAVQGFPTSRPERFAYRLRVEGARGNVLARAGRFLGLVGEPERQALAWSEPGPRTPAERLRVVSMVLPELGEGDYAVRLQLAAPGRTPLRWERWIRIVPRGAPGVAERGR